MKKHIFIVAILFSLLACQKDFLDEKSVTVLTQDFYKTPEGLEALVKGTYQVLRFKPDYNQGHYLFGAANDCEVFLHNDDNRIAMGLYRPDGWGYDAEGIRMTPMVIPLLGAVSGNDGTYDITEGMYPVINRCNAFLEGYRELSAEDKEKVAENLGEILFMRTYAYYLLTNVLGDVPLVLESSKGLPDNFYFPKTALEEIYKRLITDMRIAVENLPESVPVPAELGRIAKPAAAHLLAKLYLNRAQAADFQSSSEEHLKMLYKGNVPTDLDSAIYYATIAIDIKRNDAGTIEGLASDFGDLWQIDPNDVSNLSKNHARDLVSEIMLSAQYEGTGTYNGRYGGAVLVHLYNQDYTVIGAGIDRNQMTYARPYRSIGPNDWAYDMYTDKINDSRFHKTYIPEYAANLPDLSNEAQWTDASAYYYNQFLLDQYGDEYYGGDSARAGEVKIELDKRSLVFIENSKDQPLDSLWCASQPFVVLARWVAYSPDGAGYVTRDGNGNITGFRAGAAPDPENPVVTDVSNRDVRYRVTTHGRDGLERYGCDVTGASLAYMSPSKYVDRNRGQGTDDRGNGSIDIPLIRLAETYLIRAEAYGRKGDFASAIADINVLRQRAAYHVGDRRSDILVNMQPEAITGEIEIQNDEKVAPYTVNTDSYEAIRVTGEEWQAGTEKAAQENYPPTVATTPTADPTLNRFIHFIYNEKARELIFEQKITEDLHNAGILWERVYYRDYFGAPSSSTGTDDYPFPYDEYDEGNSQGAIGTGRGQFEKKHTFKAWPIQFLQLLTDEEGNALTNTEIQEYQNPGY